MDGWMGIYLFYLFPWFSGKEYKYKRYFYLIAEGRKECIGEMVVFRMEKDVFDTCDQIAIVEFISSSPCRVDRPTWLDGGILLGFKGWECDWKTFFYFFFYSWRNFILFVSYKGTMMLLIIIQAYLCNKRRLSRWRKCYSQLVSILHLNLT